MKSIVGLVIFFFITCSSSWQIFHVGRGKYGNLGEPETDIEVLPTEQYFDQKLDHFSNSNTKTWKQRYFENATFYKPGEPIFLMIGGEAEISPKWMVAGAWIDYAQTFGARCLMVEHRFYGKSRPTDDLSVDNLSYLSSEQALADLAWFITSFNSNLTSRPTWIVFGGSYAGSLASWMRLKYPHLVKGAISSSAPLLALPDFKDYFGVVQQSLAFYHPACVTSIAEGTKQLASLLSDPVGQGPVDELFHLCDTLDPKNELDVSSFYEALASNFAGIVQYNKDNRQTSSELKNITIDVACQIVANTTIGPEVKRLAAVNSLLLNVSKSSCMEIKYEKMIKLMQNTSWESDAAGGVRQWVYQTCTEFGFFQTSDLNSTKTVFGDKFPVEYFIGCCTDIYGKKFDAKFVEDATRSTNIMYGGMNDKAENVVYVQGSIDPWHELGITKVLNKNTAGLYIIGTAHCADMYPPSPNDPLELTAARRQIRSTIRHWLS